MFDDLGWFVKSYFGLYIIAPVLNAFIKGASKRDFMLFLILFYIFQTMYGWYSEGAVFINRGYSSWSFIGLYMLARFVRLYSPITTSFRASFYFFSYLIGSLILAVFLFTLSNHATIYNRLMKYSCPLVIFNSMSLILFFSKISIKSKIINLIAKSCFAVYLMHFYFYSNIITPCVQKIVMQEDSVDLLFIKSILVMAIFYLASIIIDRLRLFSWSFLNKHLHILKYE